MKKRRDEQFKYASVQQAWQSGSTSVKHDQLTVVPDEATKFKGILNSIIVNGRSDENSESVAGQIGAIET